MGGTFRSLIVVSCVWLIHELECQNRRLGIVGDTSDRVHPRHDGCDVSSVGFRDGGRAEKLLLRAEERRGGGKGNKGDEEGIDREAARSPSSRFKPLGERRTLSWQAAKRDLKNAQGFGL